VSTERAVPEPHVKQRVANALFVWLCHVCKVPIGVVKKDSVQVRYKGVVIEGGFPFLRKCTECHTMNCCSGPSKELLSVVTVDINSA
jgi:hypothetical protein